MGEQYFTRNVLDNLVPSISGVKKQLRSKFPAPELNRGKWKQLKSSKDEVELMNLASKLGQQRVGDWVLENMQRDLEET